MPLVSLPCEPGLLAEARAERRVAQRQCGDVEDLVGVVGRHRHLGGADEVEVLPLDPVDVVGGLAEEAGALHRARPDQRRGDDLGEAGGAGLVHRQVDQRELELGADAGEEVEARARHLGAALDVDGAAASGPARRGRAARSPRRRSRAACRSSRARRSRPRRRPGSRSAARLGIESTAACQASSASVCAASAAFTSAASSLVRASRACFSVALGLRDLLAERLLLAPLGLEVDDRLAALCVRRQRLVDHRVGQPALGLGGAHAVRLVAEDAGVDHVLKASGRRGHAHSRLHRRVRSSLQVPVRGPAPSYFCPCWTDRASCSWAGHCCRSCSSLWVLVAVVQGWGPVDQFDQRGDPAQQVGSRTPGRCATPLRVVEVALRDDRHDRHDTVGRRR